MRELVLFGLAGSLRRGSFNRAALRAAQGLVPAGARLEIDDELAALPPYDGDLEAAMPEVVLRLKARIRAADAILFVTPEYNYSVPGVLKNAIDWASRPAGDAAWTRKPAAIMGASTGQFGTVRAQHHLRQILVGFDMPLVTQPEVMITRAADKFGPDGALTDAATAQHVSALLEALVALARRYEAPPA